MPRYMKAHFSRKLAKALPTIGVTVVVAVLITSLAMMAWQKFIVQPMANLAIDELVLGKPLTEQTARPALAPRVLMRTEDLRAREGRERPSR
jgi:hypothetical protein